MIRTLSVSVIALVQVLSVAMPKHATSAVYLEEVFVHLGKDVGKQLQDLGSAIYNRGLLY